jgi:hypothetical protein
MTRSWLSDTLLKGCQVYQLEQSISEVHTVYKISVQLYISSCMHIVKIFSGTLDLNPSYQSEMIHSSGKSKPFLMTENPNN